MDLGGVPVEDVEWIDVGWPLEGLKSMILIDTPGIASLSEETSARTTRFLTPEESPSSADAVVYLMRHLHASDVKFLEAFRDTAAGVAQTICAVGVLSRSDEIGSGRIDSLLSAGKVARRYERDGDLASLVLGVIPVAGLVAEGARTLRENEYTAFRELAGLERADRERLLVSADRFTRESDATTLSSGRAPRAAVPVRHLRRAAGDRAHPRRRRQLLRAVGCHGEAERSGRAAAVRRLDQFRTRATTLKVRGVLLGLEKLIRENPRDGTDEIRAGIERISATAHTLRELTPARTRALGGSAAVGRGRRRRSGDHRRLRHARRTCGSACPRMPTPRRCASASKRSSPTGARLAESPLTERAAVSVCFVVIRSLDEIAADLAPTPPDALAASDEDRRGSEVAAADDAVVTAADVVLTGGPGHGLGHDAEQQGEQRRAPPGPQEEAEAIRGVLRAPPIPLTAAAG